MSSKRRLRRRTCESKVRRTKEEAETYAYYSRKRGIMIYPYKCKFCGGWHVGHPNKRQLKAISLAVNAQNGW